MPKLKVTLKNYTKRKMHEKSSVELRIKLSIEWRNPLIAKLKTIT